VFSVLREDRDQTRVPFIVIVIVTNAVTPLILCVHLQMLLMSQVSRRSLVRSDDRSVMRSLELDVAGVIVRHEAG